MNWTLIGTAVLIIGVFVAAMIGAYVGTAFAMKDVLNTARNLLSDVKALLETAQPRMTPIQGLPPALPFAASPAPAQGSVVAPATRVRGCGLCYGSGGPKNNPCNQCAGTGRITI